MVLKHRVCYLTPLPVDYPMVGVRLRIDQMISAMTGLDFVDLLVWRPKASPQVDADAHRNAVATTCADLIVAGLALTTSYLPRQISETTKHTISSWLRDLRPDLVLATHPMFTPLVPGLIREGHNVVVDTYNVEQSIARQSMRLANNPPELAHALCQYAVLRRQERTLVPLAKEVWAVSDRDVEQLSRIVRGRAPVALVPSVIDIDRYTPASDEEPMTVGFFADFSYYPNEMAAEKLLTSILPALRKTVPGARLYLVGRNPSPRLRGLAAQVPDVVVTGTVDDTRPWIARCAVLAVPIEHGSGTRLKILEGLAMGKPMVTTAKGCEGLNVQDGIHLRIRDIRTFPAAISSLLLDPSDGHAMGQRGRALVAEKYSLTRLRTILSERLEEVLHQKQISIKPANGYLDRQPREN